MENKYDLKFLEDYSGTIWIFDDAEQTLYNRLNSELEDIELEGKVEDFKMPFHGLEYHILKVEKK